MKYLCIYIVEVHTHRASKELHSNGVIVCTLVLYDMQQENDWAQNIPIPCKITRKLLAQSLRCSIESKMF